LVGLVKLVCWFEKRSNAFAWCFCSGVDFHKNAGFFFSTRLIQVVRPVAFLQKGRRSPVLTLACHWCGNCVGGADSCTSINVNAVTSLFVPFLKLYLNRIYDY